MPTNLATALTDTADRHAERTAIKVDDFELSFEAVRLRRGDESDHRGRAPVSSVSDSYEQTEVRSRAQWRE